MSARILALLALPLVAGCDTGGPPAPIPSSAAGRTLTTRPLLPTPVNSLLLDPFVTADTSWGHFLLVAPSADPAKTGSSCPRLPREILSNSPVGVSAPTVVVSPKSDPPAYGCTALATTFTGSEAPVTAALWVSLADADGNGLPFPAAGDAGASTLADSLRVSLLPNTLPTSETATSFAFEVLDTPVMTIAGRAWGRIGLPAPVAVPEGGWMIATLARRDRTVYLAGPEIVPTDAAQLAPRPGKRAAARPTTDEERGAVRAYARQQRLHPTPRRRDRVTP